MSSPIPNTSCLPLVWTVGFCGRRHLTPVQEANAKRNLPKVMRFLAKRAAKNQGRLTAISSIARGGDVLFAEACLHPKGGGPGIPWRCLLPFAREAFLELDLATDVQGQPLPAPERAKREIKARHSLQSAYSVEDVGNIQELSAHVAQLFGRHTSAEERSISRQVINDAYLECGCRTVDEADAMVFLLNPEEFEAFREAHQMWLKEMQTWERKLEVWKHEWQGWRKTLTMLRERCRYRGAFSDAPERPAHPTHLPKLPYTEDRKAGTAALALYALAARRPCVLLNADDPKAVESMLRIIPQDSDPEARIPSQKPKERWFVDPMVTGHVATALNTTVGDNPLPTHNTPPRQVVQHLYRALDSLAMKHQADTQGGLRRMLLLHLMASCVAAIFATVLDLQDQHWEAIWRIIAWVLVVLALVKPLMAFTAMRMEHHLEKHSTRTKWVECRILAEVCSGALARWDLPEQPMDAIDEEDFPKVKRLIRSLRLLRMLDPSMPTGMNRAQYDEAMGKATLRYAKDRLESQANYFQEKRFGALNEERYWHRCFRMALLMAIVAGTFLVIGKVRHALHKYENEERHHKGQTVATNGSKSDQNGTHEKPGSKHTRLSDDSSAPAKVPWPFSQHLQWLQAIAVMAPFVATYALGMISVLDCRRRALRYEEMRHYLSRLAQTLRLCRAGPSRLRLIEHAERMMIEEQHEWFSVTRNYCV